MKVIYSIGSKFGGHGIGSTAAHAVRGIYRAKALKKILASYRGKMKIPRRYVKTMGMVGKGLRRLAYHDPTGWGYILHDNIFDRWAASQLESCSLFHGWNHHCLRSLLRAKELGAITVVERASSHILQGQEISPFRSQMYVEKCLKEYEEADYILVPSDYARQSFLERGFEEKKVVKIPFGVDSRLFGSSALSSQRTTLDKFVVLYVGEIRLGKGIQYLLEAWDALKLKDAELWLVGEEKRDMRRAARKPRSRRFASLRGRQKNKETVKFLGFRKDVSELMGQANVFAFPSLDEGSALVTYEAMAAGLPVIATPNAGSLVRDSLDGYIIPIRDTQALAERLEFFYRFPEQARAMGESGRERIKEFTWEKYGEELVKAYIRMLK